MQPDCKLNELPEVKWRCPLCGAAYQELWQFGVKGKAVVELGLKCHQCKKISQIKK